MIQRDRVTATLEGDFVIFLIGMRIKKPVDPHLRNADLTGAEMGSTVLEAARLCGAIMSDGRRQPPC